MQRRESSADRTGHRGQRGRQGDDLRLTCRHPLMLAFAAASTGVVGDNYGDPPVWIWLVLTGLILGVWQSFHSRRWSALANLCLLLAIAAGYAARHHFSEPIFAADDLGWVADDVGRPVCVRGVALIRPKRIIPEEDAPSRWGRQPGDRTRFEVRILEARDGQTWRSASGRAVVTVRGQLVGVRAGDTLQLWGTLRRPIAAQNPGQFSQRDYDMSHGRLSRLVVNYPQAIDVVQSVSLAQARWWLPNIQGALRETLWRYLSREQYGLAAAVLLGARENLGQERQNAFFVTGTIHLLAISGLHVSIVAAAFLYAGRFGLWPERWTWVAVIAVTIAYWLIAESRAPVLRATILIVVLCLGELRRRPAFTWNTLAAAGLVVLAWNPGELFQVGAILSFLAVAALTAFAPGLWRPLPDDPLDRLISQSRSAGTRWLRRTGWKIGRLALASTAVWIVVLPLVVYHFHIVSPIGLLLNMVLFIPIASALFSGFAVLCFAWLAPPLARQAAHLCDKSLLLLDWSVRSCQDLPFGHTWWAGPSWAMVVLFYAGMVCIAMQSSFRRRWLFLVLWMAGFTAAAGLGMGVRGSGRDDISPGAECTFLAVGHGCCVVLRLPDGKAILFDAGALGDPRFTTQTISSYLWHEGYCHLDGIVLSHADVDHYNALPGLIERFSIGEVWCTPRMHQSSAAGVRELWRRTERSGIPVREIQAGQLLLTSDENDYRIEVLHPAADLAGEGDNAHSVTLDVGVGDRHVLLTGDIEGGGLERLLAQKPRDVDVAMAPHHGSSHSEPDRFVRWCLPEHVVVSGSMMDSVAAWEVPLSASSTQLWQTGRDGAVRVTLSKVGVAIDSYLRDGPEKFR